MKVFKTIFSILVFEVMRIFKIIFGIFIVTGLAIILNSCEDLLNQAGLNLFSDYQDVEFTIEPMAAGEYSIVETMDAINVDSIISDSDAPNVEELVLHEATLEIKNQGGTQNFDAFESFEAIVASDAFSEITVASITNIPDGLDKLTLDIIDTNLINYVDGEEYTLKVRSVLDKELTDTINILGKVKYKIKVGY